MIEINAVGKQCPIPLVMLRKSIAQNGSDNYAITVDNKIAVENLTKLCKQFKYEIFVDESSGNFVCSIFVPDEAIQSDDSANAQKNLNDNQTLAKEAKNSESEGTAKNILQENHGKLSDTSPLNDEVVVFDSNVMGDGDDKLGAILIKGFIFALSQEDKVPKQVVCYNSGVKLACAGSESAYDLKLLESKGCQVMACGTCLDFYDLTDKLISGEVVNMYDIVTALNAAKKIVRP